MPESAADIAQLFRASHAQNIPVTFRSGGTSLSGQAVTDGLLVDTRRAFRTISVLDGGGRVTVQPGATVRQVNLRLTRLGRKLGPDPASESACTIGGVVANNSSGMACGTEQNTYRTLESLVYVLPSGTLVDSAHPDADTRLARDEPELYAGLTALRDRVRGDATSTGTIRRLFAMKNTMGYSVNAFVDFTRPVDILTHLMVGSEGTLGFVAEATFHTVELMPAAATGLAIFADLADATAALPALVDAGLATIELMDATSLRVAQQLPDAPAELTGLTVQAHAALLIELQAADAKGLDELTARSARVLDTLPLVAPVELTRDPASRARLWHIRKGLYTAVAEARSPGTTALLEDVVVPVAELGATCEELIGLFDEHGYENSVIFGHAKDGNIHFMLNERFDNPASLERYRRFTEDMVELVLAHGGSLKAEHGTGRIMAPFVRRQYGDELYDVMTQVKSLCDPRGLLNPGVVLSDDPDAYLRDLKMVPTVESEVDRCVECGYCEPVCPSKDLTMTPRQRIVVRREMRAAEQSGDLDLLAELRNDYEYDGVETCAVDGMCQTACPVAINTGDLVRRLRQENAGAIGQAAWKSAAKHWDGVSRLGGAALTMADAVPAPLATGATKAGRAVLGTDTVPLYDAGLPRGGAKRVPLQTADPVAVYFPACINSMFGPAGDGDGVSAAFLALCERAGVGVVVPDGIGSLCCGTPWKSKGFSDGFEQMSGDVLPTLWRATQGGRLPVVCDASSCTEGLDTMRRLAAEGDFASLRFVDAVSFVREHVLNRVSVTAPVASIALHPTCSSRQLGMDGDLVAVAAAISSDAFVPDDWGCCAFAGDRGLLHPELTASATAPEATEVNGRQFAAYASTNRTCEIGLSRATGHEYRHILELLEQATR
ncbi:FAD-binding oxidoreductase [Aeromicrobium chenweiae]|uniref:D-lactate dehydrogenase (cytochrome) n=2 Tax=Aeromicrobium chenweiae TaxID=2079793 RepID=A0A2S0WRM4_9ACTN|nr:FAD-binding oxidoreductase [Aeromicrobium chenweiae]TGN31143.1 FAD-binding oxidoreductase [Aeromicrobium chenweiae]